MINRIKHIFKNTSSFNISVILLKILGWLKVILFISTFSVLLYLFLMDSSITMLLPIFNSSNSLEELMLPMLVTSGVSLILAILFFVTAKGLKKQKVWARALTIIISSVILFVFPIGTIMGTILVFGVTKGWPKTLATATNKNEETNSLP